MLAVIIPEGWCRHPFRRPLRYDPAETMVSKKVRYFISRCLEKPFWGVSRVTVKLLRRSMRIRTPALWPLLGDSEISIVDAGAAGGYAERWETFGKNLRIYLFDPEPRAFAQLEEMYGRDSRVRIFNYALSDREAQLTLHVTRWPFASSVYRPNDAFMGNTFLAEAYEVVDELRISARPLASLLEDGEEIDFIKADVEGHELPLLIGAGELLEDCIGLELEVTYQPDVLIEQPLFADVDAFCRRHGFKLLELNQGGYCHFKLPSKHLESKGFLFAGDALYFRRPDEVARRVETGRWPPEKILKAAALYMAYRQYEPAYILLEEAAARRLVARDDPRFEAAFSAIRRQSGHASLISDQRIRNWCEGWSPFSKFGG